MAGIPQNFQNISPVIANYDFVDIASGTGYINFYAGTTVDLSLLSNFTFYSDALYTTYQYTDNTNVYTLLIDKDFDVELNRPMDLNGLAIINIPIAVDSGGAFNSYMYVTVKIRKWDGSSETEIANNDSRVLQSDGDINYTMLGVDVDVPLTHFKKGETLRLTLLAYGKAGGGARVMDVYIAHDPMSRVTDDDDISVKNWEATGAVPSKLLFQCPVRLNL